MDHIVRLAVLIMAFAALSLITSGIVSLLALAAALLYVVILFMVFLRDEDRQVSRLRRRV